MDEIFRTNRERWNALANAEVEWSRPFLDYTPQQAAAYVYRYGILKDVSRWNVLCLASGGGQDSVALGLLGARVTVLDLSDVQLARDRQAATHHGLKTETLQGDMRDLSRFPDNHFDLVWQPYSVNFVPSVEPVFREVARVLKPGGVYYLSFANPFVHTLDDEAWDGNGYPLHRPYIDGEDVTRYFPHWDVTRPDGSQVQLPGPHEFRHTLSTVLNTMAHNGFIFLYLQEWMQADESPEPGSWAHFTQVAPPWFDSFWELKRGIL